MKQALFLASGFAWLNLASASAACCRSRDTCLKAIVSNENGIDDCASVLIETVSAPASIVTEIVTVSSTQYTTVVGTEIVTETESTTAATETVFFTESSSVTIGTETVSQLTTETTIASTETVVQTLTVPFQTITVPAPTLKKRAIDTLTSPAPVQSSPALPEYASDCPSFEKYTSACKCAGGEVITITVPAPVSTVTVEETTTVLASVASTVTSTETDVLSLTATTSSTETDVISLTATASTTQTNVVSLTATVTAIETATAAPEPVQVCLTNTAAFRAMTVYNGNTLYMFANLLNGLTGGLNWQAGSTSTSPAVQPKYNLAVDSQGYLYLHDKLAPYPYYTYYLYISTNTAGSQWPQINNQQAIESSIANGGKISKIKGCVNSVTGQLTMQDSLGRSNILYCGAQVWLSSGLGEDINRGGCYQQFPQAVAPYLSVPYQSS